MKNGTKLIVSNGQGTYTAFFIEWLDDTHIKAINRFGGIVIIDQSSVEDFFV